MATTVGQILNQARNRHPAFHKRRVPDRVVVDYLSDVQSSMMTKAMELDFNRVAIQCSVVFATSPANIPGTVGAGSSGGLPGQIVGQNIEAIGQDTGPAIELDIDNAPVLVPDTAVSVATALTATLALAAWAVNQFANQLAVIVAGTGYGQRRSILSNTAGGQLVISTGADGQQWATIPDATSVIRIVQPLLVADEKLSLVTELPPKQVQRGYLVSLDAQGKPYINLSVPLEVVIDAGIPLPGFQRMIGGSVRVKSTSGLAPMTAPLTIRNYLQRYLWGPTYTCWLENDQLFLAGTLQDWTDAISVDLRMVPDPPDFTSLADFILLPDFAGQMLVAAAAEFMAMRCAGQPDTPALNVDWFTTQRTDADAVFLAAFGSSARAHASYVREVW